MNVLTDYVFDMMLTVIRTSGYALVVALAAEILVLILNALRIPRRVGFVLLWVVLLRMLVPVSLPSRFSIFNLSLARDAAAYHYDIPANGGYIGDYDIAVEGTNAYDDAIYAGLEPSVESDLAFQYVHYTQDDQGNIQPAVTYREKYGGITALIWLASILLFWGYGILSALILKRRVSTATILEPGVYETDRISAPFILGIFRPKIYLPTGLDSQQREMILCHERMHLRWGDHIVKVIAYFAAGLHWYNIWLGLYFYRIFLQQMEEACDQDALRKLGAERKADYSEALLNFSTKRQFRQVVTVAFGESWIKERIQQVLKYKKPLRWLTVPAMVLVLASAVSLGTSSMLQDGSLIELETFTTEEMDLTGLPDNVIRFDFHRGDKVGSVSFDLEVWSSDGLVQRQRISTLTDAQMDDWDAVIPLEWEFDLQSNTALQGLNSIDWILRIADTSTKGSIALSNHIAFNSELSTNVIGQENNDHRYIVKNNTDVVLFCGLLEEGESVDSQISCSELCDQETISLAANQTAVILRMHLYSSKHPFAITIHDLLPDHFAAAGTIDISAEGNTAELTGDKAKELRRLLSDISFTYTSPLGDAMVADDGLPKLRLKGVNDQVYEITIYEHYLLIYDVCQGELMRAMGDHLSCRRLAAMIYRELAIEKSAQEIYQLSETIGESSYGWMLSASDRPKDVWLYTSSATGDFLLISGLYSEPFSFYNGDTPNALECCDLNDDGRQEIFVFCESEDGERFYVLSPQASEWHVDLAGQRDLNHWMASSYGEYVDNSDLAEILIEQEPFTSLQFSKTEVLGDWANAKYVNDHLEDHYKDAHFYLKDGRLFVTATRVLHMQKDDQHRYFPAAQVTAEIRYLGAQTESDPFAFCNFLLRPLPSTP